MSNQASLNDLREVLSTITLAEASRICRRYARTQKCNYPVEAEGVAGDALHTIYDFVHKKE